MCYSWCFVHSIRNNFRIQHTSRHNQRDLSLYKQSRWGTTQQQVLRPVWTWHHMVCQYYNQSRCSFPSRQSHIRPTSTYSWLLYYVYLSDCVICSKQTLIVLYQGRRFPWEGSFHSIHDLDIFSRSTCVYFCIHCSLHLQTFLIITSNLL